jgi:hypothetical protein
MSISQKLKKAIERFSFAQMTSNNDGKTSGSGTMGVLICTVGALCFLLGCADKMFIGKDIDILNQAIVFTLIGAGLLGYRKSVTKLHAEADIKDDKEETEK